MSYVLHLRYISLNATVVVCLYMFENQAEMPDLM